MRQKDRKQIANGKKKDRKRMNKRFFHLKHYAFVLSLYLSVRLLPIFSPFTIHPFPILSQFSALDTGVRAMALSLVQGPTSTRAA